MISNIDTFLFTIDPLNYDSYRHFDYLEALKEESKFNNQNQNGKDIIYRFGTMDYSLLPNGDRFHAYILENDWLQIKLAKGRSKSINNYPISIRISSQMLWTRGLERSIDFIKNELDKEGFALTDFNNKISRADLCCHVAYDFSVHSVSDFKTKTNVQKVYQTYKKINAFYFGQGMLMARIYNKTLEINQKNDKHWFEEIYNNVGMFGDVWNVEFQLTRKFFSQNGVETVQDFITKQKSLWVYLTDWLELKNNDATRTSNKTTARIWIEISKCFGESESFVRKSTVTNANKERLLASIIGYITSYNSYDDDTVDWVDGFYRTVGDAIDYLVKNNKDYRDLLQEKRKLRILREGEEYLNFLVNN